MSNDGARFQFFHVDKIKTPDGLNGLTAREHEEDSDHDLNVQNQEIQKNCFQENVIQKNVPALKKRGLGSCY